jgi:16S rRNA processing protein RimM
VFVEIAEVVNVVGLRGEIKLLPNGNYDPAILTSDFLVQRSSDGREVSVHCSRWRTKGTTVVAVLDEIRDRDAAEAAVGSVLGFRAAAYDEPGFPRGEDLPAFVYHGLTVVTTDGRTVGRVDDVLVLPANWVLSVIATAPDGGDGEQEILIPVIDDVIREVDREGGRVVIEPMPGLLDDEEFV